MSNIENFFHDVIIILSSKIKNFDASAVEKNANFIHVETGSDINFNLNISSEKTLCLSVDFFKFEEDELKDNASFFLAFNADLTKCNYPLFAFDNESGSLSLVKNIEYIEPGFDSEFSEILSYMFDQAVEIRSALMNQEKPSLNDLSVHQFLVGGKV